MQKQIESTLAEVFTHHSDRRLDLFKVTIDSADETQIKLSGRVLTPDALSATRSRLSSLFPQTSLDTSAVRVLRATPGPTHTVATNLTDLHAEPSFLSELLTQVLLGQPLELLDTSPDGKWAFVRQTDGYLGWAYKPYLSPAPATSADSPTHVVIAASAVLCKGPASFPVTRIMCGTFVRVLDERDGWCRVALAGNMVASEGYLPSLSLRSVDRFPLPTSDARMQIIHDARTLLGTYYLWGGSSPFGIDCSGLAQLTHRLAGYTLPRDADMQFKAARPLEPSDTGHQPGDLLFFHSESSKDKITHVAICTGGWNMVHSSRSRNGVYEEDLQQNDAYKKTYAGARSFLPR